MAEIKHEVTDEIVCPWCGNEYDDSNRLVDEGESEEMVCEDCGKPFVAEKQVWVYFNTSKIERAGKKAGE
jgi:uncharacterized Zn-finger protein